MPGQSGTNLIKPGNNWINRGKRRDHSLQARKVTSKNAKRVAMRTMSPLTVAMLLGFDATALVAATGDRAKRLFGCDRERRQQRLDRRERWALDQKNGRRQALLLLERSGPHQVSGRSLTTREALASTRLTRYNETRPCLRRGRLCDSIQVSED